MGIEVKTLDGIDRLVKSGDRGHEVIINMSEPTFDRYAEKALRLTGVLGRFASLDERQKPLIRSYIAPNIEEADLGEPKSSSEGRLKNALGLGAAAIQENPSVTLGLVDGLREQIVRLIELEELTSEGVLRDVPGLPYAKQDVTTGLKTDIRTPFTLAVQGMMFMVPAETPRTNF